MAREPLDRRARILSCAAGLFSRKGVAATTVREIADEAGILSGSLYHHFESKEAIVNEILSNYLEDLRGRYRSVLASGADPGTRLHDLVVASLEVVEAHPHATEIYQNEIQHLGRLERFGQLRQAGRDVQHAWIEVITAGVRQGVFRADLDPKILYRLMRDSLWLSVRWFTPTRDYPSARLAEDCTSLFLNGIAAQPDRARRVPA
jgi:TetR/AcrR family transcriptional regulator, cholesterol catabolism regulator